MFIIDLGAESYYSMFSLSPDASPREIRDARDKIGKDLTERILAAKDPIAKKELEERQRTINNAGETLARSEDRAKYDKANAHLRFFLIQNSSALPFFDKSFRIEWLHQVIREFLASKGADLSPLSDLERTDFSGDETPNDLLDALLKQA
jgi:hypothetical protein